MSTAPCEKASACLIFPHSPNSGSKARTPSACSIASAANDVDVRPGRMVYTQWLNEKGGIEADLTVTRLADDCFLIVTAAETEIKDFSWLKKNIPDDATMHRNQRRLGDVGNRHDGPTLARVVAAADSLPTCRTTRSRLRAARKSNSALPTSGHHGFRSSANWAGSLYVPTEFTLGVYDQDRRRRQRFRPCPRRLPCIELPAHRERLSPLESRHHR